MHLDIIGLEAALVALPGVVRHVGEPGHAPLQRHLSRRHGELEPHAPQRAHALRDIANRVLEAGQPHAVLGQPFEVQIGEDHLFAFGEALGLRQQLVVLVNQRLAVPSQVGSGFPGTGRGIQVGGHAFAGLRGAEVMAVFRLADGDVAGGQVG